MVDKLYKFTFKIQPLGTWDTTETTAIKYKGIEVGEITHVPGGLWHIHFKIKASETKMAKNPNCPWMWAKAKQAFETQDLARKHINDNREMLLENIYFEEE